MNIRSTTFLVACLSLTGCESLNSFFQMDSNSPSPFFGLSLAVDANEATKRQLQQKQARRLDSEFHGELDRQQLREDFELTSRQKADDGDIRYTLNTVPVDADSELAAEVSEILPRL